MYAGGWTMKWAVLVVLVIAVGVLIHMNRFRYVGQSYATVSFIVRVDRLTGATCFFSGPERIQQLSQLQRCN